MNCRPYDIAEIVSASPHAAHLIGKRVVVTEPFKIDGVPCWAYLSMQGGWLLSIEKRPVNYLEDHHLKAIDTKEKA